MDRDESVLPIRIDTTSNGEFAPIPVPPALRAAKEAAGRAIAENARRTGRSRREFLASLSGAATTLLAFNAAHAALGRAGGAFTLDKDAALDEAAAAQTLAGDEFIFDVHLHMVNPAGAWRGNRGKYWEQQLARFPFGRCGEADPVDCFSADHFIEEVFLKSDTAGAVLSFVPETPEGNPLDPEEARRVKALVDRMGDARERLFLHAMVTPNLKPYVDQLDLMTAAARTGTISAWKIYTQWGTEGTGFALDSPEIGVPFIERARETGVKRICIHKGLPFPDIDPQHASCADIGRAARAYPDVDFLVYHSGYVPGRPERAFDPSAAEFGVDSLVKSLLDNDVAPNSNVWADLGATWWILMRDPEQAAHALGKLLKHVGEDRLLWGTDAIWFGSPQDQIQAFRAFEISEAMQEAHGYPALTPALKRKVFGLNGAKAYGVDAKSFMKKASADGLARRRHAGYVPQTELFENYGPQTLREFRALLAEKRGLPA